MRDHREGQSHAQWAPDRVAMAPSPQLPVESLQSSRKKMKGNESKIAFICFHFLFGIGTFQQVTADSNKKMFLRLSSLLGLCAR
jgi:hypothetical protein